MIEKVAVELAKWITAIMVFISLFLIILGIAYLVKYLTFSWYMFGLSVLMVCFIKTFIDGILSNSGEEK